MCLAMAILIKVGGFEFYILNQKVYIGDIGGSGHIVLYILLWHLWKSYNKRKEYWKYILNMDYRIRPLVYFFGIPVLIWFAIPYPNHINDFFKFIINRKTENIGFLEGIYYYYNALKNDYFYNDSLFIISIITYFISIMRYKYQEDCKRWLILTSLLQLLMVISHHQFVLYCGITFSKNVMQDSRFNKFAFAQYTDNNQINDSFKWIKNSINEKDSIAILGKSNTLSPSLFFWNLGPPKGYLYYIGTVNPKQYSLLKKAKYIAIIAPNR